MTTATWGVRSEVYGKLEVLGCELICLLPNHPNIYFEVWPQVEYVSNGKRSASEQKPSSKDSYSLSFIKDVLRFVRAFSLHTGWRKQLLPPKMQRVFLITDRTVCFMQQRSEYAEWKCMVLFRSSCCNEAKSWECVRMSSSSGTCPYVFKWYHGTRSISMLWCVY